MLRKIPLPLLTNIEGKIVCSSNKDSLSIDHEQDWGCLEKERKRERITKGLQGNKYYPSSNHTQGIEPNSIFKFGVKYF